jgi:hypothetical protein
MQRRSTKVAAVALANKTARIIWALMTSGERYRGTYGLSRDSSLGTGVKVRRL